MKLKNAERGMVVQAKRHHDCQLYTGTAEKRGIVKDALYRIDDVDRFCIREDGTSSGELRLVGSGENDDFYGWHDAKYVRIVR